MPSKEKGKRRGIEEIEYGKKRARNKQRSFYVNEIEDNILDEEQKALGYESFREYIMAQVHFCRRFDRLEGNLEKRFDKYFEGREKKEEEGIDADLHPEMIKQVMETVVKATSQYHIMRSLLQRLEQTYDELREGAEAFLWLDGLEFDEISFQHQLIVLISQNIVFCDDESQPPIYCLSVVRDLLEKREETLLPE